MSATELAVDPYYETHDIIIGYGEVPGFDSPDGIYWSMPGNEITFDRDVAIRCAERLDKLIQANQARYNRKLVW